MPKNATWDQLRCWNKLSLEKAIETPLAMAKRIEPMRRSAVRLVSLSSALGALLLMAHPQRYAKVPL